MAIYDKFKPTDRQVEQKNTSKVGWVWSSGWTVVVDSDWPFDNLCGSHLQSQSELYDVSWWYYTLVIHLIGQLRRDVIGRLLV